MISQNVNELDIYKFNIFIINEKMIAIKMYLVIDGDNTGGIFL